MPNIINEIREVLQSIPAIVQEAQAARAAIMELGDLVSSTEWIDLVLVEVLSLLVPNLNPPDVMVEVSPPQPPPTVQPPQAQPQPQPAAAQSGTYAYIPLDLGGHYPPREKPQPPKIHRPAHIVEQERQAAQRSNVEKLEAALADVPLHINDLHTRSGIAVNVLLSALCQLELQGRVRRFPGERYARIAAA